VRYVILLMTSLLLLAGLSWCFLPHSRVPRFRVRYLRARLHLRLHPGRGHATVAELWLRWGRLAAVRRSRRSRPSLTAGQRLRHPALHSLLLGRAHYWHCLQIPVEEHVADHGAAQDRQDWSAGPDRHALSRPGREHHDQA